MLHRGNEEKKSREDSADRKGDACFSCSVIGAEVRGGMLRPKKSAFEWDLECGIKRKAREKETADYHEFRVFIDERLAAGSHAKCRR